MKTILLVLRYEIQSLVTRFSFWFGALGLPIIAFVILLGITLINQSQGVGRGGMVASPFEQIGQVFSEEQDTRPQGFADLSGIVKVIPSDVNSEELIFYSSEAAGKGDFDSGKLGAFFVIAEDYLSSGQVTVYTEEYNLVGAFNRASNLEKVLTLNLLQGDENLARAIDNPLPTTKKYSVAPPSDTPQRTRDDMWYFFIPYAVMMLFYISILGSAGLLLNSVTKEKENRVIEVLLLSIGPLRLLLGKIIGLGIIGLFQMVIWLISSILILNFSGQSFQLPSGAQLPPGIIPWGIVFFILGYLVYAALMAGAGALVPNLREASQATIIVIIPLIIPLLLINVLIEAPNNPISVVMSLFPLTSPTTMMLRLAATNVPTWQPVLAVILLVITDYLVIRLVAGMFRAQTLLSGQPFKVKNFLLALVGKGPSAA